MDFARKIGQLVIEISGLKEVIAGLYSLTVQLGEQRDTARKSCAYWQEMYEGACNSRDNAIKNRQWAVDELTRLHDKVRDTESKLYDSESSMRTLRYDISILKRGRRPIDSASRCYESCNCYDDSPTLERLCEMHAIQPPIDSDDSPF